MSNHYGDTEKNSVQQYEDGLSPVTTDKGGLTSEEMAMEKRVIRKVDIRLLLILGALYSVSLIDRTNVSTARVRGMAKDLALTVGERYSTITVVFFAPYIVFELPSNILLRRLGARNLLSLIAVLWGVVMTGSAFVKTWKQLTALRVVLGFFESGFFPGCVFLISTWYTRWETQRRLALFYLISMCASAFSQILGYGLSKIPPHGSLETWRYIFFVEGLITIALGILAYFLIVDFPEKNKFLTPTETQFVINRVNRDRGDALSDTLTPSKALRHLLDWRTWFFGLCFMSSTLCTYAFAYFLPVILAGAGYAEVPSLLLSVPPYAAAAIFTIIIAILSDRYRQRGLFVCINALTCLVGCFIIGYALESRGARYFGSFLAVMGGQSNVPAVLAYGANNTITHSKKAVATAVIIGMGGVGGIFASLVYRQADYPRYLPGLWATIGAQFLIIFLVIILTFHFHRANKLLDKGLRDPIHGVVGFRYSI